MSKIPTSPVSADEKLNFPEEESRLAEDAPVPATADVARGVCPGEPENKACMGKMADKTCAGSPAGARTTRTGRIKTRRLNKPNAVLAATLGVLAAVTVLTFVLMDYGDTPLAVAAADAGLFTSLALATLTTVLGAVIAFVLGLLAAMNLSNRGVSNVIKAAMSLFRAIPTILWVLIFTVAIGLGPEAAVAGLLFHGVAYLTKAYSESFEEVDPGVVEALRASGASWWQVVFSAVVPEKLTEILSWTFIRFEINFVNAVAVGAVAGAGGIGYQLFLAGSFYYDIHEVGTIVYFCLAVALVLEVLSTQLRKRYLVQN